MRGNVELDLYGEPDAYTVIVTKEGERYKLPPWSGSWSHTGDYMSCGAEWTVNATGKDWRDIESIQYDRVLFLYEMRCPCCGQTAKKHVDIEAHNKYTHTY